MSVLCKTFCQMFAMKESPNAPKATAQIIVCSDSSMTCLYFLGMLPHSHSIFSLAQKKLCASHAKSSTFNSISSSSPNRDCYLIVFSYDQQLLRLLYPFYVQFSLRKSTGFSLCSQLFKNFFFHSISFLAISSLAFNLSFNVSTCHLAFRLTGDLDWARFCFRYIFLMSLQNFSVVKSVALSRGVEYGVPY